LRVAAELLTVRGIERRPASADYSWNRHGLADGVDIVSLAGTGLGLRDSLDQQLVGVLAECPLDAVVLPGWVDEFALTGLRWCLEHRKPAILMSESQAIDERRSAWKEFVKRQVVGCFAAALVGGVTHAEYVAQLGMPSERIFQGYDAVDNEYFRKSTETLKEEARKQYRLPEKFLLASARFIEKKNLPRLLEAYARYRQMAEARRQRPDVDPWSLVLLGDGPLRPQLEGLIADLRLQSSVLLPGFKQYPDLPTYYGCASAFIHASTTEQWGLVVNEAMASGLPVLVSNRCGCAPDLVQEGVNGFTFDPYNVDEIANAMLRVWQLEGGELDRIGGESKRIIASWGTERFASGLKQAVGKALEVGAVRPTIMQRIILKLLLRR